MLQHLYRGGMFISLTTRRNHATNEYTGKFTFWPSEQAYRNVDCNNAWTFTAVYLGNIATIGEAIDEFIDNVLKAVNPQRSYYEANT